MGHETYVAEFDGKLSKKEAINKFLMRTEDMCSCDFPRLGENSFKDCYISSKTRNEIEEQFYKILDNRYGSSQASIAKISLPNEEKAFKSKSYQSLQDKINLARKEINNLTSEGYKQIKTKKTKKCPGCHSTLSTASLRYERCPSCNGSLLSKGISSKIKKIADKISSFQAKQQALILKQPVVEKWIIGIEYHT